MKPYLESLRRTMRTGLVLFILCVVGSVALAIQQCTGVREFGLLSMFSTYMPLLAYTFVGGVVLALDGFSFLNKRADSDYYHSLPITRRKLFWAIALAALTWIAATVLASVILNTVVFTLTKTPFVPYYPLVAVPFYIVATMLVFAATAIGCSLSGTILTDLAITALVLFLPRFLQFAIGRGVVAKVLLLSWLDLPWYLIPTTNIATGQIVCLSRIMLKPTLFGFGNIAYSLVLTVAELFLAALLFKRRPSELAEHGAKNNRLQIIFTCLLTLPVCLLLTSGAIAFTLQNAALVLCIALGCFVVYQTVVQRNARKVVRSLPWFLVPVLFSVAAYFGVQAIGTDARNYIPAENEIAYVVFDGRDRYYTGESYGDYLVSKIRFEDKELNTFVLDTLAVNIASVNQFGYFNYDYDPETMNNVSTEPVTIVLKNGHRFGRLITFTDGNKLNALREKNAEYAEAVRTLAPFDSICFKQSYSMYAPEFARTNEMLNAFYAESKEKGLIPYTAFQQHPADSYYYVKNEAQSFGSVQIIGYVGLQIYSDYFEIKLETPLAAAAWMRMTNKYSASEHFDLLKEITDASESFLSTDDSMDVTYTFYNVPMGDGNDQTLSFYYSQYGTGNNGMSGDILGICQQINELLLRSHVTENPNDLCVYTVWNGRAHATEDTFIGQDQMVSSTATDSSAYATAANVAYASDGSVIYVGSLGSVYSYSPSFRAFDPADEAKLLELLQQWRSINRSWRAENNGDTSGLDTDIALGNDAGLPYPSPTPAP